MEIKIKEHFATNQLILFHDCHELPQEASQM